MEAGLDTNGCPLGNSKFILLSDNPNICLWLSACQVEKSNQLNDSWSNIYQRLSQPEAMFRKYKHLTCSALFLANSIRFILVLKRIKSDWRATPDLPWLTLLFMVSIRGVLLADYCPACRTTLVATRFRVAVICPIIQVPHCIRVFFYFVWFVFINHIFQFYYELCTYCNILDIYLS